MARPKKVIKRSEIVRVRYTPTEKRMLKIYSGQNAMTVSSFVRSKSLDHKLKPILSKEEIEILRPLISVSNSLNQVVKKAHLGEFSHLRLTEVMTDVTQIIERFK